LSRASFPRRWTRQFASLSVRAELAAKAFRGSPQTLALDYPCGLLGTFLRTVKPEAVEDVDEQAVREAPDDGASGDEPARAQWATADRDLDFTVERGKPTERLVPHGDDLGSRADPFLPGQTPYERGDDELGSVRGRPRRQQPNELTAPHEVEADLLPNFPNARVERRGVSWLDAPAGARDLAGPWVVLPRGAADQEDRRARTVVGEDDRDRGPCARCRLGSQQGRAERRNVHRRAMTRKPIYRLPRFDAAVLDVRLLRESPEIIRANLERRGDRTRVPILEATIGADREWRSLLRKADELKHRRNVITKEIAAAKKAGKDAAKLMKEATALPVEIKGLDAQIVTAKTAVDDGLMRLPNLLHASVPAGAGEADNVELRRWGTPRTLEFELRPHGEVLEALGVADFERGRKAAGAGFFYLKGALARLDLALQMFALEKLVGKGFIPVLPPLLLRRSSYEGMVDLSAFEEVMYKVEGEDLYAIATSEHPIGAMFQDEILDETDLPLKFAGVSTNFRKEIGAHGVDTKGLYRVHQFNKVEQFVFCRAEDSWRIHEELLANTEDLVRELGLPHRVVTLCAGETGRVMAKTYDLEVWFPRQGKYGEVASISNATGYQARRLKIRAGKIGGAKEFVHTLNATAIATSRTIVAIVENFVEPDGTIPVPQALRQHMGGVERIVAPATRP